MDNYGIYDIDIFVIFVIFCILFSYLLILLYFSGVLFYPASIF